MYVHTHTHTHTHVLVPRKDPSCPVIVCVTHHVYIHVPVNPWLGVWTNFDNSKRSFNYLSVTPIEREVAFLEGLWFSKNVCRGRGWGDMIQWHSIIKVSKKKVLREGWGVIFIVWKWRSSIMDTEKGCYCWDYLSWFQRVLPTCLYGLILKNLMLCLLLPLGMFKMTVNLI